MLSLFSSLFSTFFFLLLFAVRIVSVSVCVCLCVCQFACVWACVCVYEIFFLTVKGDVVSTSKFVSESKRGTINRSEESKFRNNLFFFYILSCQFCFICFLVLRLIFFSLPLHFWWVVLLQFPSSTVWLKPLAISIRFLHSASYYLSVRRLGFCFPLIIYGSFERLKKG